MVADVTVVGAGIIALSAAAELADRGMTVRLIGTTHHGQATLASAGMLTPTVEEELHDVYDIALAARDLYPEYLSRLEERTSIPVPLNRLGALRIALTDQDVGRLQAVRLPSESWLDAKMLADLEPALGGALGALLSPDDGCVDPLLLMDALRLLVARHSGIEVINEDVCNIGVSEDTQEASTNQAGRFLSRFLVLAAGAWSPKIDRMGTPLPIEPVRGQIVSYRAKPLTHVTYGPHGYLVPKADGTTLVGSTFEHVGFDHHTTDQGIEDVKRIANTICPSLPQAPVQATWAGLRPVTPDMLPIIGPDPEAPNVVFACGHSRNGILLAPLTARIVADFVTKTPQGYDVHRFRPERF